MAHKCTLCNGKGWITRNGKKIRCTGQKRTKMPSMTVSPKTDKNGQNATKSTPTITVSAHKFALLTATTADELDLNTAQTLWEIYNTPTTESSQSNIDKATMVDNITSQLNEQDAQTFLDNNVPPYFNEQNKNAMFNKLNLATHPWMPPRLLALLSRNKAAKIVPEILHNIAENPTADKQTLQAIADDALATDDKNTLCSLVRNPHLPNDIAEKLIQEHSDSEVIIINIAENTNVSPEILDKLSRHDNKYVRESVADNHNTSENTLHYLLRHEENTRVQISAILNPNYSKNSVHKLYLKTKTSEHSDTVKENLYLAMLENPNVGYDTLQELSQLHGNGMSAQHIRKTAKKKLKKFN